MVDFILLSSTYVIFFFLFLNLDRKTSRQGTREGTMARQGIFFPAAAPQGEEVN